MPYLNELITLVNDNIRERSLTDKRFAAAKLEGIAYQVAREATSGAIEMVPVIADMNKVERYIGIDDTFPLVAYHRILSNTYSEDNKQGQYGDGFQSQQCSTEAVLIVFGKRSALQLTAEQ